ncbi:hypothetical protein AJ79_07348 [Helicocarpus griseus UAMH5409]|uniref:Uncharacterized protein n=1 Tax=Helicocarpus griseus UAMH5409 TaxID=1447875 RepID=A0A2B7X409_9EURO|nr:hypothetical protein AJ79_07348 [Helicocarpus griseus UAMH5409]
MADTSDILSVKAATELASKALEPLNCVVWGEAAMGRLGVPTVCNGLMLVPAKDDFDLAVQKLENAGFRPAPWSYASINPEILKKKENAEHLQAMHASVAEQYRTLDAHSKRFVFPQDEFKLAVLYPSYVEIAPPAVQRNVDTSKFFCKERNFYYPDKVVLLESMIRTLLKDEEPTMWKSLLTAWAVSYICGYLDVSLDALDECDDENVKTWYNKEIRRDLGGLDKTRNKRTGRAY